MKKLILLVTPILILSSNAMAAKLTCTTIANARSFEVELQTVDSRITSLLITNTKTSAQFEFFENDITSAKQANKDLIYINFAKKQLSKNLYATLKVSKHKQTFTHVFLTLSNNLGAWDEPVRCK